MSDAAQSDAPDQPDTTTGEDTPAAKSDTDDRGQWSSEQWRKFAEAQVAEADKWKSVSRKHEDRAKANAKSAKELEDLRREQMSESEKAIEEARTSARQEAIREVAGRLVDAEVKAAAAGRLSDGQRDALLDGLDRSRFLTDDGDVDTAKVAKWVDSIAPAATADETDTTVRARVDLGQGRRSGQVRPSVAAGRDLYAQLRGNKTTTPS